MSWAGKSRLSNSTADRHSDGACLTFLDRDRHRNGNLNCNVHSHGHGDGQSDSDFDLDRYFSPANGNCYDYTDSGAALAHAECNANTTHADSRGHTERDPDVFR